MHQVTHQVILFGYFEQQYFLLLVIREEDLQAGLAAKVEAAEDRSSVVEHLHSPLLVDLHADGLQGLLMTAPLEG